MACSSALFGILYFFLSVIPGMFKKEKAKQPSMVEAQETLQLKPKAKTPGHSIYQKNISP